MNHCNTAFGINRQSRRSAFLPPTQGLLSRPSTIKFIVHDNGETKRIAHNHTTNSLWPRMTVSVEKQSRLSTSSSSTVRCGLPKFAAWQNGDNADVLPLLTRLFDKDPSQGFLSTTHVVSSYFHHRTMVSLFPFCEKFFASITHSTIERTNDDASH